jgi:hypothetical protein
MMISLSAAPSVARCSQNACEAGHGNGGSPPELAEMVEKPSDRKSGLLDTGNASRIESRDGSARVEAFATLQAAVCMGVSGIGVGAFD